MDWIDCKKNKIVKEKVVDLDLVNSLLRQGEELYLALKELDGKKHLVKVRFVLTYDYFRQFLEALALSKGFKIQNHECYSAFLKTVCKKETEAILFDKFRFLRNGIQYYAKNIDCLSGEELIKEMLGIVFNLKKEYFGDKK